VNEQQRAQLADLLRPRLNRYIAHAPTEKQQVGLILPQEEILYGGAGGGGKSDWLLMGALQFVDVPGYSALILRKTFKQLELEGGLLERAWTWLAATDAQPHDGGERWTFGDHREGRGAVLQFGYLDGPHDHERYQGSNWQYVGFDELTHFREKQYRYLFSRLRRPDIDEETPEWRREIIENLSRVPLRMRAASNPGSAGHEWVKERFAIYVPGDELRAAEAAGINAKTLRRLCHRPEWVAAHNRAFVPALLEDNPHLDQDAYDRSLAHLDPTTRRQLRLGDWDARDPGEMFRREWFTIVDAVPLGADRVRYWDLAATEPGPSNDNPDYTVGLKLARAKAGEWYVEDVVVGRWRSARVEALAKHTAALDGPGVSIGVEQEPGASGKALIMHWQRDVLPGFAVKGYPSSDSKAIRARPVASKSEAGLVNVVRGAWNSAFFDAVEAFPPDTDDEHDDIPDALSGAFTMLSTEPDRRVGQQPYRSEWEEPVVVDGELALRGERYVDRA
jgi:predicted phage terminase large subunit-like protein